MAAKYVRIPYGTRLKYPHECPFTGQKNPKGSVQISRSRLQLFIPIPIPFVGALLYRQSKVSRIRFPASKIIAVGDMILKVMPLAVLIGGLVPLVLLKDNERLFFYSLMGWVFVPWLLRWVRWLWLSRVRIV